MHKYLQVTLALTLLVLVNLTVFPVYADVVNVKDSAPSSYTVKKGDTLWDISNLFLSQPWLWPELWRSNTQIENPHLIYPGDILRLKWENGRPVLELVRNKDTLVLSPGARVLQKPSPISVLPWQTIAPYISNDSLMDAQEYQILPTLLGDRAGTPRFASKDYVLTHKLPKPDADYQVVRKEREVYDSMGKMLGVQVSHLSDVSISKTLSDERHVVRIESSNREAMLGDKLLPVKRKKPRDLKLKAATRQTGELVGNINGNSLIGKRDVVIINLGKRHVKPGTVFGIYKQGPDIEYEERPSYVLTRSSIMDIFSTKKTVEQPAYKVGELIVVKNFEHASYAWVTQTSEHLVGGELIAKP